jgi:hypothetical protein
MKKNLVVVVSGIFISQFSLAMQFQTAVISPPGLALQNDRIIKLEDKNVGNWCYLETSEAITDYLNGLDKTKNYSCDVKISNPVNTYGAVTAFTVSLYDIKNCIEVKK